MAKSRLTAEEKYRILDEARQPGSSVAEVRHIPDLNKAKKLLGFAPKVALEERLERSIQWHKCFYQ